MHFSHMQMVFPCDIIRLLVLRKGAGEMYQTGDRVIYGIHGVCRILDVEEKTVDRKKVSYYVLEPLDQQGTRYYIPAHNQAAVAKLNRLLSASELEELLASARAREDAWIADEGQRKQRYRELINSSDREALLAMIHALHRHKQMQVEAGRKFHLCDENFLRDAEKLLRAEFSLVLEIPLEQVGSYIAQRMQ